MIGALAGFALRSTAVLLFAGIGVFSCRRLGASYRHLIWTAGFTAILVLPLLQAVLPSRALAMLPAVPAPVKSAPSIYERPMIPSVAVGFPEDALLTPAPNWALPKGTPKFESVSAARVRETHEAASFNWSRIVPWVWLLGALICLAQYLAPLAFLRRKTAGSMRISTEPFGGLTRRAGVRRAWTLLREEDASGPRTWGVLRPVIAIPRSGLEWPREQLDAVVLHELAHVRRLDSLTQSIATIACAANWLNPMVWFCAKLARKEAEQAADDAVLMAGVKPSVYAEALVRSALESKSATGLFLSVGVPLMKQSKIESRIQSILSQRPLSRRVSPFGLTATAIAALAIAAPCAALSAKAATPEPDLQTMVGIEVTHAGPARLGSTARQTANAHKKSSAKRDDLHAQIAKLKAELAAEHAQLAQIHNQMSAMKVKAEAEAISMRAAQMKRSAEDVANQRADMESERAAMKALRANNQAQKRELETAQKLALELDTKYRAGALSQDEYNRARAKMDAQSEDMAISRAEMATLQEKLRAEKESADGGFADKAMAESLVQAREAEIQAKRGERQAAAAEYKEVLRKREVGLATQDEVLKVQADLEARQAAVQAAEAEIREAKMRISADQRDARARHQRNEAGQKAAKQRIESLMGQLQRAQEQLTRQQKLRDQGALSNEVVDEARARVAQLKAALAEAKAQATSRD